MSWACDCVVRGCVTCLPYCGTTAPPPPRPSPTVERPSHSCTGYGCCSECEHCPCVHAVACLHCYAHACVRWPISTGVVAHLHQVMHDTALPPTHPLLQVDTDALRELCWSGIPPDLRPVCWRLLLGYLPPNKCVRVACMVPHMFYRTEDLVFQSSGVLYGHMRSGGGRAHA